MMNCKIQSPKIHLLIKRHWFVRLISRYQFVLACNRNIKCYIYRDRLAITNQGKLIYATEYVNVAYKNITCKNCQRNKRFKAYWAE
jgi:hypothetical protein